MSTEPAFYVIVFPRPKTHEGLDAFLVRAAASTWQTNGFSLDTAHRCRTLQEADELWASFWDKGPRHHARGEIRPVYVEVRHTIGSDDLSRAARRDPPCGSGPLPPTLITWGSGAPDPCTY